MSEAMEGEAAERLTLERLRDLKMRYLRFLDGKQWDQWREVFCDDLVFEGQSIRSTSADERGDATSSADDFVGRASTLLADAKTVHIGVMPEIEILGPDTASGTWTLLDYVNDPTNPALRWLGAGRYRELYERDPEGRWRIKSLLFERLVKWPLTGALIPESLSAPSP